jgi:hypothetical protein
VTDIRFPPSKTGRTLSDAYRQLVEQTCPACRRDEVTPNLEDLSEAGKFHFSTWVLGLGKAPFGAASVDDGPAAKIRGQPSTAASSKSPSAAIAAAYFLR